MNVQCLLHQVCLCRSLTLLCAFLSVLGAGGLQAQPAEIRVLVIYSDTAKDQVSSDVGSFGAVNNDIHDHAEAEVDRVNEILTDSGLAGTASVVLADVVDGLKDGAGQSYDETTAGGYSTVRSDVQNNTGSMTAGGKSIDELRTERMADVVVVVANPNGVNAIGGASPSSFGDPSQYVIVVDPYTRSPSGQDIWAHELGHMGGLTHENQAGTGRGYIHEDPPGTPVFGTVMARGIDESTGMPVCAPSVNGCQRALVYSDPNATVVVNGVTYPAGDSTHNEVGTLSGTLGGIAGYAEDAANAAGGAPGSPAAVAEFLSCIGHTSQFSVTWWSGGGGPTATFEIERLISSTWFPYYEDYDDMCKLFTSSQNTHFRIRAHNAAGTSDWNGFLADAECN